MLKNTKTKSSRTVKQLWRCRQLQHMKIGSTQQAQTMTRCHFDDRLREQRKNATATAFWQINTKTTTTTTEDNLLLIWWSDP